MRDEIEKKRDEAEWGKSNDSSTPLTFPGSGGMFTRVLSRSRTSRNASKSEYRLRTTECRSLNAGMLVWGVSVVRGSRCDQASCGDLARNTHHADNLVVGVHLPPHACASR